MARYPKRILVVEDNKLDMRLLKDILEGSGYETLQAADGLEAIDLAFASLLGRLLSLDLQPRGAGRVYQACRACRPRWRWTLPSPRQPRQDL